MTDVISRLENLMQQRNWTAYRLETICEAFGITLAQFFAEDLNMVALTPEQKTFFDDWANLTSQQKELLEKLVHEFK